MSNFVCIASAVLLALSLGIQLVSAETVIVPGAAWTDTSGNSIQAHGAGILKVAISPYWTPPILTMSRLAQLTTGLGRTKLRTALYFQLCRVTRLAYLSNSHQNKLIAHVPVY